ncbi:hypothetical protein BSKO_09614 [Bryopsis sp. KO-2023]|nr:hypothetical protein BSKO_09614 [Bryopsis sp. KO-2023]
MLARNAGFAVSRICSFHQVRIAKLSSDSMRGVRLKVQEEDAKEKWRNIVPIKRPGPQGIPRTMESLVSSLCWQAQKGDDYTGYDLLDEGADPNGFDRSGWNALLYASDRGHLKFIELLLERGAQVNVADEDGYTPLMQASDRNHARVVKELIVRGAKLDTANNLSRTALHLAIHSGNHQPATLLIDAGAAIETKDQDEWTPLHYAAHGGYTDLVRILLGAGAHVDPKTKLDETPLHLAACTGTWQTTQVLLANGANPNATKQEDWTPLHCAAWWGHDSVIRIILRNPHDSTLKNKDGDTALEVAKKQGYKRVVETLEKGATRSKKIKSQGLEEDEVSDDEELRPNRLETVTITLKGRKFVTAARTMAWVKGSYFWMMLNPGKNPGSDMIQAMQDLQLGDGPGSELKQFSRYEFEVEGNPVHFEFVLDYVRKSRYSRHRDVKFPEDKYVLAELLKEARFYRVPQLVEAILEERSKRQRKTYKNVIPERKRRRMVQSGSMEPRPKDTGKWYIPNFLKDDQNSSSQRRSHGGRRKPYY